MNEPGVAQEANYLTVSTTSNMDKDDMEMKKRKRYENDLALSMEYYGILLRIFPQAIFLTLIS